MSASMRRIAIPLACALCVCHGRRLQSSPLDEIQQGTHPVNDHHGLQSLGTGNSKKLSSFASLLMTSNIAAAYTHCQPGAACLRPVVVDQRSRSLPRVPDFSMAEVVEAKASLSARSAEKVGAIYRFSRPHTIKGTLLACFTGVGRAIVETPALAPMLPAFLPQALKGMAALLLGNLFIVGINQIYDVEIDKTNKPFLPIAAGRITPKLAWTLVLGSGAAGLAIVRATFDNLIFSLYAFGTLIGGLYSVPPFQLKRFPLAAGLTIATCRGFLLNFGVYYAARSALGLPFAWSPPVDFLARFMTVYAAVIAVTKDLPDIEGDRQGGIDTFASRMGPGKVARGATAVLLFNYCAAIVTAIVSAPGVFHKSRMIIGHALAAGWLIRAQSKLDANSAKSIKEYYKQIWNLFYFEYMLYPFI